MNLQKLSTSRFGVGASLFLGRTIPPGLIRPAARFLANRFAARRDSGMAHAVRANQWVVRGGNVSSAELDRAVRAVFRHAGDCFIDLYHSLGDPRRQERLLPESEAMRAVIEHSRRRDGGLFLVAGHQSNFDLVLLALARRGLQGQLLSFGNPTGGYEVQNRLRAEAGWEVTPIGPAALQQAIRRLQDGGVVATGIDRPASPNDPRLSFFGRPAALPVGHIRMALMAHARLVVVTSGMHPDGTYFAGFTEPIELERRPDRQEELVLNAERVLKMLEGPIRQAPEQWLMFYPVWPETLPLVNPPAD
jgi:KDO2-lipid IV(A) lauroyltransferase